MRCNLKEYSQGYLSWVEEDISFADIWTESVPGRSSSHCKVFTKGGACLGRGQEEHKIAGAEWAKGTDKRESHISLCLCSVLRNGKQISEYLVGYFIKFDSTLNEIGSYSILLSTGVTGYDTHFQSTILAAIRNKV